MNEKEWRNAAFGVALAVCELNDGLCMDVEEERNKLAGAIVTAFVNADLHRA